MVPYVRLGSYATCVLCVGRQFISMGFLTHRNAGKEVTDSFFLNCAALSCMVPQHHVIWHALKHLCQCVGVLLSNNGTPAHLVKGSTCCLQVRKVLDFVSVPESHKCEPSLDAQKLSFGLSQICILQAILLNFKLPLGSYD